MKRFRLCNFATVIAVKDNEAHMLQTAWYYLLFFSSFFFFLNSWHTDGSKWDTE